MAKMAISSLAVLLACAASSRAQTERFAGDLPISIYTQLTEGPTGAGYYVHGVFGQASEHLDVTLSNAGGPSIAINQNIYTVSQPTTIR
jgi:hypothetical protein